MASIRSSRIAGKSEVTSEARTDRDVAGSSAAATSAQQEAASRAPTSSSPPPPPQHPPSQVDGAPSTSLVSQPSPRPSSPTPSHNSPSTQSDGGEDVDVAEEKKAFLKSHADSRIMQSRSAEGAGTTEDNSGADKKLIRPSSCSSIIRKIRSRDISSTAAKLDSSNTELKGLTCAVCLEIYTNPKFLPCHHTYCARCIEDLAARRANKPFKCPSCRKEVTLPAGGVNALQHNFYIKQEDLEKAARGFKDTTKCKAHAQQELDMYCIQCEQVVCFKCVLTKHKEHALQDLTEAAEEAAEQLKDARPRLDEVIRQVNQHVDRQQREQHDLEEKIAALKRNLQNRHDTILAAVGQYLDERLSQLDKLTEQVSKEVKEDASFAQSYLSALNQLQKVMDTAIKTKARVELVEADRDMRVGFGCRQAVDELLAQRRTKLTRPVLHFQLYTAEALNSLRDFFGEVVLLDMPAEDSEEEVLAEKFRCGDAIDTEVFSICPKDNDTMSISYERRRLEQQAPSEGVDVKGKHQYTRREALGKSTWKSRGKGKGVFVGQLPGQMRTYCKGQSTEVFLRLDNHLTGYADVKREIILSESPYKSKLSKECSIKCGPHRAFDVDESLNTYAVVEEGSFPKSLRKVLLFRKQAEEDRVEWTSPLPQCQPTDVCFYSLDGNQVLLIADEMNDAIYVVDYMQGELTFLRYLAAGSPLMVQPTALNVDVHKRLWVAGRGGGVLMMERVSPSSAYKVQTSAV